ncbi:myeloid-associated differentiation marker homolog [Polymixia lowei]
MPVIVLEARDLTSPLFLVRTWAVFSGCLTFSLVASLESYGASFHHTFRISCMFTWCVFFILTLLIHVLNVIQFHSLIPISWKNLTMTVAASGALMCLSSTVVFSWIVMEQKQTSPRPVAAAVASCLTFLAYTSEACVIRHQAQEQRGYMASVPGLLKILQFWGSCQMIPLVAVYGVYGLSKGGNGLDSNANTDTNTNAIQEWQLWVSGVSYCLCLLMSLGSVVVILGDCAGRCPLPFDRLLASFSLFGVLLYMVATVICFTKMPKMSADSLKLATIFTKMPKMSADSLKLAIMETVIASITLLAYIVDLVFSIKLLCDRSRA